MSTLFILQNQTGYFISKAKEWTDGRDLNTLYRSPHKDEAINMLFEVNSRDVNLRITIKECEANAKKLPILNDDELPPPLPKAAVGDTDVNIDTKDNNCSDKHQLTNDNSDEQLNNHAVNS